MSIRKRSATTGHQARRASSDQLRRLAAIAIAGSITIGILAGCAQGSSQNAERGKLRDAQRTSVVSGLQATKSVIVLEPGTPPPPTSTPGR